MKYDGFKRVGPFSTDNWQSDQIQTAEEQYDPYEFEEPVDPEEEDYYASLAAAYEEEEQNRIRVVAACTELGDWWEIDLIPESDFEAHSASKAKEHKERCSCGNADNFVCTEL